MATKKGQEIHDPEEAIESALYSTENFLLKNGKMLLTVLAVAVLLVGGYFGYKYVFQSPRDEKAATMMYIAEQQFIADSFEVALNGDGNNAGFLSVIDKYGSTIHGNLAKHYAGVCYLKLGKMDEAMTYLKKYDQTSGVPNALLNAQNYGLQGDILSQQQKYSEAVAMYDKAVKASNDPFTSPVYLKKLGLVYTKLGEPKNAAVAFESIMENFPTSMEAREAEKFLGKSEQQ